MDLLPIGQIAQETETHLHEVGIGFDMGVAQMYSITIGMTDDNPSVCASLETEHPDVYSLLESDQATEVAKSAHYVALVTTGWAAPLNPQGGVDGVPSEHPERRRVRLTVIASRQGVASVVRFADNDETALDEGQATGTLADAIHSLMNR